MALHASHPHGLRGRRSDTMTAAKASIPGREPHAPPGSGARGADAFARAERHSRRVRWLKYWLPGLAVAGVIGFIAWSYLAMPTIEGVEVQGAAISDGKLVMANPKLDGFTRDNLPYTMTALRAVQDLKQTNVIQLEDIDAKVPVGPENSATIVAKSGTYDNGKNTLVIDSAMTVTTTDGMTAKLQSASMDMDSGTMTTTDPVEIVMNGSKITADTLNIVDNGKVLVFEKRVRVEIEPTEKQAGASGTGASDVAN
jgi:lipopolysaccharide export system protein LptC